ncbi:MAG: FAD-binding protein, partial [Acidimicrobiia bacterium]|nr:FAD-binding protein [Acidimicrobiia bacterium]
VAAVGAGARLADVYDELDRSDLTIPAGCGPSVGISGLTLGGGIGILGRKHGLTADHLVGAEIVLADGLAVSCDDTNLPDLFWALRGAGAGNFGVVTSMKFTTIPVPNLTDFHLVWPYSQASRVIDSWQRWAPKSPQELAASLLISMPGEVGKDPQVNVFGTMLGSESQTVSLLDELVGMVGSEPTIINHEQKTFRDAKHYLNQLSDGALHGEVPQTEGLDADVHDFSKSEFFRQVLPNDAIDELVENLGTERTSGQSRELDFSPWGGAYNQVAADATAFPHRSEFFLLKQAVAVPWNAAPGQREEATAWLDRSWALTHPWGSGGVYPNFPDPELEGWGLAYYGKNYSRLTEIKKRYDPDDLFRFHQSIPPADT